MKNGALTIDFDFAGWDTCALGQLNGLLAAMRLNSLKVEIREGYLVTTKDPETGEMHCRYVADRGRLECELAQMGRGHQFQIDTLAVECFADDEATERALELWRKEHLDRVLDSTVPDCFGTLQACVIVHRNRAR